MPANRYLRPAAGALVVFALAVAVAYGSRPPAPVRATREPREPVAPERYRAPPIPTAVPTPGPSVEPRTMAPPLTPCCRSLKEAAREVSARYKGAYLAAAGACSALDADVTPERRAQYLAQLRMILRRPLPEPCLEPTE